MSNAIVQNILLFNRLSKYSAEQIFQVIHNEASQTVAVILSRLDPKKAKEVLGLFPSADQKDIIYRMATTKSIPPEIMNEVANVIGEKLRIFEDESSAPAIKSTGQERLAEILKHMDTGKSKSVLEGLARKDTEMSDRIKRRMFLFEDIVKVEPAGLKQALMKVDTDILALALKGSSADILKAVLEALSENRQKMLIEELKHMGPRVKSEIDRARNEVVNILRELYDDGILRLKGDHPEEKWV
jgi:flagellar motor switch protein FliG